ncbi:hypothetical protein ACM66B_002424 [Microbotryomycetes sp. NB124-2]
MMSAPAVDDAARQGEQSPAEQPEARAPTTTTDTAAANNDDTETMTAEPVHASTAPASSVIEQELSSVLSGLGSFWGKVRKQSANVYQQAEKQMETARKDLTPLMEKAKANLDSIGEQTRQEFARLSEQSTTTGVVIGPDGFPILLDESPARTPPPPPPPTSATRAPAPEGKGKGVDPGERDGGETVEPAEREDTRTPASDAAKAAADQAAKASASAAAFFSRLQTQVASNPNVKGLSKNLSTLQHQVQHNLSSLPTNLQTNLAQLQEQFAHIDLSESSKTAEAYLTKGEHWLQEFSSEVGRLALETVKVVPPNEADMAGERTKRREERLRKAEEVAIGRRDLLVARLRSDPDALLVDPAAEQDGAADTRFAQFLRSVEDEGGIASEVWRERITNELDQGGDKIKATYETLVPSRLTHDSFWSRFFFRVAEIDADESRRKQILDAQVDDDDFSWDMDDEDEPTSPRTVPASANTAGAGPTLEPPTSATTPGGGTTPTPGQPGRTVSSSSASSEAEWGFSPDPREETGFVEPPTSLSAAVVVDAQQSTPVAESSAKDCASPRASSDGTSSYDIVGERSGAPSERGDDAVEHRDKSTKESKAESDDSDWE